MNNMALISKLQQLDKKLFTVQDLSLLLGGSKKGLRTRIARLRKQGVLQRVGRGLYTGFGQSVDPEQVAVQLYHPSYLSLQTVLSKVGVINQIPYQVYLVTPRKTYQTQILNTEIVYRQIKPALFFGFQLRRGSVIAYPEKALLDLLYFATLGKAHCNWDECDLSRLKRQRWQRFLPKFPQRVQDLAKSVLDWGC
jgi:predicted transcriptional regulator of viral defense system